MAPIGGVIGRVRWTPAVCSAVLLAPLCSGLARRPLKAVARVRIPSGLPGSMPSRHVPSVGDRQFAGGRYSARAVAIDEPSVVVYASKAGIAATDLSELSELVPLGYREAEQHTSLEVDHREVGTYDLRFHGA